MRLSKRECVLITVLAVLLTWFAGGRYILEPAVMKRAEARQKLERVSRDQEAADRWLDSGQPVPELPEYIDEQTYFYEGLDDVSADRILQEMAAEAGVAIYSMEIGKAEFTGEGGMNSGTDPAGYGEENVAGGSASGVTVSTAKPSPSGSIYRITVRLELNGSRPEDAVRMAELIYREPKSVVLDFMEIQKKGGQAASASAAAGVSCHMDVSFYGICRQAAQKG